MKKCILLFFLVFAMQCQTAMSYGVWPYSAITSSQPLSDGSGIRIAVIDTGISIKHLNAKQIETGQNYVYPNNNTNDLIGHGTAIAGILLGSEDMSLKGLAPGATLVPLTCYTRNANGSIKSGGVSAITQAIYGAVDIYNCKIINVSSGVTSNTDDLRKAAAYAEAKGVVVVSSVGNDNKTAPKHIYYPAAYETVIGVGAIGRNGKTCDFSQRNKSVSLVAPGKDLQVVTIRDSIHPQTFSGTSYAAAFVTGAAALLLSEFPNLRPEEVRKYLYSSALDIEAKGYDTTSGWGALQIVTLNKLYIQNQ
jgi:subtilisin family serine protease